jgi:hypothetical protein
MQGEVSLLVPNSQRLEPCDRRRSPSLARPGWIPSLGAGCLMEHCHWGCFGKKAKFPRAPKVELV